MGRCLSPCDGSADETAYADLVDRLREALTADPAEVLSALSRRMSGLADDERYEEAGTHRDRLSAFLRGAARTQRLAALARLPELVAAGRDDRGRWAVHVVRHGRLAAAGLIPPGSDAHQFVAELRAGAETVCGGPGPVPAASAEESERVLRWLESPGVRLVHVEGEWSCPPRGAGRHLAVQDALRRSHDRLVPFDEPRISSTVHRPVRRWLGSDL